MPQTRRIDMTQHLTAGIGLLAGRDRGEAVRARMKVPELDEGDDVIEVSFPPFVYSINSSFFLGLFEESLDVLGEEAFQRKYQFVEPLGQAACNEALRAYRLYRAPLRDSE
jgi:hypothetical protein